MAQFLPFTAGRVGFDFGATPRWQMVPLGGFRHVILRDGAGLAVNKLQPVITLEEIGRDQLPAEHTAADPEPNDRAFRLRGMSSGFTKIVATRGSTLVTELEVSVMDPLVALVSFHFVRDSAGHSTTRTPAAVSGWVGIMNEIYRLQANVEIRSRLIRWVEVPGDLGPCIRTRHSHRSRTDAWHRVVALRDPGACFNVFLVWELDAVDSPADEDAIAGLDCLFEDNVGGGVGVSLAHELGHRFYLPDHYIAARRHELMYGYSGHGGSFLPKGDVQAIHRALTT